MLTKIANPWNHKTNNQKALMTSCENSSLHWRCLQFMKGDCGEKQFVVWLHPHNEEASILYWVFNSNLLSCEVNDVHYKLWLTLTRSWICNFKFKGFKFIHYCGVNMNHHPFCELAQEHEMFVLCWVLKSNLFGCEANGVHYKLTN